MFGSWNLTPAYGRDYRSKKALLADWSAGKDFQFYGETAVGNLQDWETAGKPRVSFRYGKLRKQLIL